MKAPFQNPSKIIEKLEQNGYEAYFVGGSVRDVLLGRSIGDVDIATSAMPEEVKKLFEKTIDVGIDHGTVIVLLDGIPYEVTTFRSESEYLDYRRPKEVTFISSLEEDLKRRDFTMNAIAMTKTGVLIDPFFGQDDIKAKYIQTVGNPNERFAEDALRMMRALRFVSQLSFSLSNTTVNAIKQCGALLANISIERITIEFMKLLMGDNYGDALKLLDETSLYQYLPGFSSKGKLLTSLGEMNLFFLKDESEYWTIFVWGVNETVDPANFLRKWKLSNKIINDVLINLQYLTMCLENHQLDWTEYDLYSAGKEHAIQVERVYRILQNEDPEYHIKQIVKRFHALPIKSRTELAVNGHDLIKWIEKKGGPWLKQCLNKIEQMVVEKELVNDRDVIKEWIMSCNRK